MPLKIPVLLLWSSVGAFPVFRPLPPFRSGRRSLQSRTHPETFLEKEEAEQSPYWNTALAVVPPDEAWDRLQRARHQAQDATYATWPPALRLFHPFCDVEALHSVALDIAEILEQYDVAAFNITLSQWSILPHTEQMQSYMSLSANHKTDEKTSDTRTFRNPEDREVQALIAKEERIGKEKMQLRREKQRLKNEAAASEEETERQNVSPTENTSSKSRAPQVYNGPCVICLEPDHNSREKLQALRYLLRHALPPWARRCAELYSPTGSFVSPKQSAPLKRRRRPSKDNDPTDDFRPVVPMSAFDTVAAAIPVARRLRQQWQPLTFEVTDLHLISSSSSSQWGCDALVSLGGVVEENEEKSDAMEAASTKEMIQMMCEYGEAGGFFHRNSQTTNMRNGDDTTHNNYDLERWLDGAEEEDEDEDQGTVVVLGRTQLFTGAMRQYVGMPAPRISWESVAARSPLWHASSSEKGTSSMAT
jgi:hypothetical protein